MKAALIAGGLLFGSQAFSVEGCAVYKHSSFRGGELVMASDHQYVSFDGGMNDEFSSLRVGALCEFHAYEHTWFRGLIRVYKEGEYRQLHPNDAISSAQCFCDYISE